MGADKGGGIWVHVDHGGPTHGCVSAAEAGHGDPAPDLDPTKHPVIVMGDASSLARVEAGRASRLRSLRSS